MKKKFLLIVIIIAISFLNAESKLKLNKSKYNIDFKNINSIKK